MEEVGLVIHSKSREGRRNGKARRSLYLVLSNIASTYHCTQQIRRHCWRLSVIFAKEASEGVEPSKKRRPRVPHGFCCGVPVVPTWDRQLRWMCSKLQSSLKTGPRFLLVSLCASLHSRDTYV
jgi:hypothetical protein